MVGVPQRVVQEYKAGNIASVQRYLAEILTREPENEDAWLWLAAVLNADKKNYCLRQVLLINPNNNQAQIAIGEQGLDIDDLPSTQLVSESRSESQIDSQPRFQYWQTSKGRKPAYLVIDEKQLLVGELPEEKRDIFFQLLEASELPDDELDKITIVKLGQITEVSQKFSGVNLDYLDDKTRSLRIDCIDEKMAASVFNAIARQLGPRFERRTEAIRYNSKIVGAFLLFIFIAALTLGSLYAAFEITNGNISLPISTQAVDNIGLYGPLVILSLGGLLMLATFIYMIMQYLRPPKMVKLVLDESIQNHD
jgi:hypothetical protein